jgi:hypothetical protein
MTSVTAFMPGPRQQRETGQRLSVSLALSLAAHVIAIAIFAGLLKPMFTTVPGRSGQALPIEVALVGVRPIAFQAPPESPPAATESPAPPQAMSAVAPAPTAPPPSPARAAPPANAHPLGVSVQADVRADSVSADMPPPPGNTSVSPIADSERLGHAQASRLLQRYPQVAAKAPKLRDPLIVPYPPNAARAHAEARVAALLLLDASGKVVETTLFPDEPLFGPTILGVLAGAQFVPAEANAKPIPYWVILEFAFNLGNPAVRQRPKE